MPNNSASNPHPEVSELTCNDCESTIAVGRAPLAPCPSCGCATLRLTLPTETNATPDDFEMRVKAKDVRRRLVFDFQRTRTKTMHGPQAGSLASITQFVDRPANHYQKRVILADGTTVKDVDGPLHDQSLHGGPRLGRGGS